MNPKVDFFLEKAEKWTTELRSLRKILLDCDLTEELKWGSPCYTYKNSNVVLIGGFKNHCVISFLKGVLLQDSAGILKKPGENSQSSRIITFTDNHQIVEQEATLKAYIFEAIEIEKAGLKVDTNAYEELTFPEELHQKFEKDATFKAAFEALTPGRQRAYAIYFSGAKQAKSRTSRIENYTERILNGKGFHDCICGKSKRMPNCDGSHSK